MQVKTLPSSQFYLLLKRTCYIEECYPRTSHSINRPQKLDKPGLRN